MFVLNDSSADSPTDFDFIIGDWVVSHRRLKERLKGSNEWVEFKGESSTAKILGGLGNLEDNYLHFPEGSFRAAALRSYDATTKKWSIWWLDGRFPGVLDVPVVGEFFGGVGVFYAEDVLDGVPIKIRFRWDPTEPDCPRWEQAFSVDGGQSWETNWVMEFTRRI